MLTLLIALAALAIEPPAGVDAQDPDRWDALADQVLTGPQGCWDVVGRARWQHDLGPWGSTRGEAIFVGRLRDGVWGAIEVFPQAGLERGKRGNEQIALSDSPRFTPLVGQVRGLAVRLDGDKRLAITRSGDPRVDPVNTAADVIGKLKAPTYTTWSRWDAEAGAVELARSYEVGRKGAELRQSVRFPGGGDAPDRMDLRLMGPYVHKGIVPARVPHLEATVLVRPSPQGPLPVAERLRFALSLLVVRIEGAQTIEYKHLAPCPPAPEGGKHSP